MSAHMDSPQTWTTVPDCLMTKYRLRYHVAYSCTTTSLSHEVEQYLLDGWQLQGGVSVAPVQSAPTERQIFAQALVRMEEVRAHE